MPHRSRSPLICRSTTFEYAVAVIAVGADLWLKADLFNMLCCWLCYTVEEEDYLRAWTRPRPDACATVVQAPRLFESAYQIRPQAKMPQQQCTKEGTAGRDVTSELTPNARPRSEGLLQEPGERSSIRYIHSTAQNNIQQQCNDDAMANSRLRCDVASILRVPSTTALSLSCGDKNETTATHTYSSDRPPFRT